MVSYCANWLREKYYSDIKVDLTNYTEKPEPIIWVASQEGHIPDITTTSMIFEVETADSINDEHTKDQWILFATHAANNNIEFWVVVPKGSAYVAQSRLNQLGITAKIWEV